MYITKATDLWSYWIICWKTIVNHYDFYSLNLWNILSGGLGWSSPTVMALSGIKSLAMQFNIQFNQ